MPSAERSGKQGIMRAEDVIETGQADDLICRTDAADDCRSHSSRTTTWSGASSRAAK